MRNIVIGLVMGLGALLPPAFSLALDDAECCCCKNTSAPSATANLFATGCYQGSGTDDRKIVSGIPAASAGLLVICELTAEAGNTNVCTYSMPGLTAGDSCAYTNADFDPGGGFSPCGSNRIQSLGAEYFEVGTGSEVNGSGPVFCWEQWAKQDGYHGTVVYTGNGSSPRTISVPSGTTPSAAIVWSKTNSSSSNNIPWIRTSDMAANTSFPAAQFATADDTQRIRSFSSGGIEVGSNSNVNTIEYHLAWWGVTSKQKLITYTGNGAGLDAGRCGSLADLQTVTTGCTPVRSTLLTVTQGAGAGSCTLTRGKGRCNRWRTVATGFNVVGSGNISNSNDLYAYTDTQPNNSGPGLIGSLSGTNFQVSGGANNVSSCNDLAVPYYGFVTCATAPSVGQQNPADWTSDTALVNWNMEQADSTTRTNSASTLGFCTGSSCDLANTGTVLKDTTLFKQGTASAAYSGGTDLLSCSLGTCGALRLTSALTVMGWIRPGVAADAELIESQEIAGVGQSQYRMFWRNASTGVRWTIRDTLFSDSSITSSGWSTGTWKHAVGTFSDAANTSELYVDGVSVGTASPADMLAISTAGSFTVGGGLPTANFDEVAVWNKVITATDVCRIYACGIDGLQCSCLSSDPTIYVSTGRWTGTCTLPACNKAGPS